MTATSPPAAGRRRLPTTQLPEQLAEVIDITAIRRIQVHGIGKPVEPVEPVDRREGEQLSLFLLADGETR